MNYSMLTHLITSRALSLQLDSRVHQSLKFSSQSQQYKHVMRTQLIKFSMTINEII